jgi:hypothetical protein
VWDGTLSIRTPSAQQYVEYRLFSRRVSPFIVTLCCTYQEVHILHQFEDDFYGETMRMLVLGHIRPERNFDSLG